MSGSKRYPRDQALAVAKELCAILKPLCEPSRLKVCGSLRRGKADVGDIEILMVQRIGDMPDPDDLLHPLVPTALVWRELDDLVRFGKLKKRPKVDCTFTWGDQIRLAVHVASGIPVDFFAATEENWWSLVVCRTGSAESNVKICNAAIKKGLKWGPYSGGFVDAKTGEIVRRIRHESEAFTTVGLPYLAAEFR